MKHLFKVLILSAVLVPILSACQFFGSDNEIRYVAVKMANSDSWSIIDIKDGNVIADDEYSNEPSVIVNDVYYVKNDKGLYDFYNVKDKNHTVGESYKNVTYFNDGCAIVCKEGEGLAIINTNGELVAKLSSSIKRAGAFENGMAIAVNDEGKCGFINTDGELVIKMSYDDIVSPFSDDGYAVVVKNDDNDDHTKTFIVIDKKGVKKFSFNSGKYDAVLSEFVNGAIAVKAGEEVVYLDETGNKMLKVGDARPGEYGIYNDMTIYADGNEYGIKSKDGEKIIKAKYEELAPIKNGKFLAKKDDKCMIIDKEGQQVTSDKFDYIENITEDRFFAVTKKGGNASLIDEQGNEIGKDSYSASSHSKDPTKLISSDEGGSSSVSGDKVGSIDIPTPTGDIDRDAEVYANTALAFLESANTPEEAQAVMTDMNKLKSFIDYYQSEGKNMEFAEKYARIISENPSLKQRFENASKKLSELLKQASSSASSVEEQADAAKEAVEEAAATVSKAVDEEY